jgi:hypothetical protein
MVLDGERKQVAVVKRIDVVRQRSPHMLLMQVDASRFLDRRRGCWLGLGRPVAGRGSRVAVQGVYPNFTRYPKSGFLG